MKWCDYSCEHASFPDADLLGACRTMGGVFCKKLGRVVPKHTPCRAEAEEAGETPSPEEGEGKADA